MNQAQKNVYLINIPELRGHLAQENPNQVTSLLVHFMCLWTTVYFMVSHSSQHNPATFGEMKRVTHDTLFMHFVLYNDVSMMNQAQKNVYLINIPELRGHLAQENPNQVTSLLVHFMCLWTTVYFMVSHSSQHNPATFGEMKRVTHDTLFMHFVLLKHHVYIL